RATSRDVAPSKLAERGDRLLDRVADAAARFDRAGDEEVHPAADDVAGTAAFQPDVRRDRDDAAVVVAAAAGELGEHADLTRRAVVHDRPVEPGDERVRGLEALAVDAVDLLQRDV